MKRPIAAISIAAILFAVTVTAWSLARSRATTSDSGDGRYTVLATTAMVANIVERIAGDRADVHALIGPGVDPHLYRPTTADVRRMMEADVIFYNGLNLEGKMSDTFVRVARTGKPVYAVTESISESYLISDTTTEHADPHVWMDPNGWMLATDVITLALVAFDPENAAAYEQAGRDYTAKLEVLDAYVREVIASIPESRRVLITAHDAFNYMARAYGIEVKGIQGISTESEAGLKFIEQLVDLCVERDVRAVFTESSVSDKNVRAIIEGTAARDHDVVIGGELFSDAMGEPGTYEGTYIGMIDHNATTIARALGGTAPPAGLHGRLGEAHKP